MPNGSFLPLLTMRAAKEKDVEAGYGFYSYRFALALEEFVKYTYDFLSCPHIDLGRSGNVCPFVPQALDKQALRVTMTSDTTVDGARAAVRNMADVLQEMPTTKLNENQSRNSDEMFKAIIIGFPDVSPADAPDIIDALQAELKADFVCRGMMIGQFHPNCPEPGLHNPDFRPLQAPIPALTIRYLTKYDLPFMTSKFEFIENYVSALGEEGRRYVDALLQRTFQSAEA